MSVRVPKGTPRKLRSCGVCASNEEWIGKRFLEALSDGGLTAALAACMDLAGPAEQRADQEFTKDSSSPSAHWFKDTSSFVEHDDGRCLEARLDHMQGVITPTNLFFVRNNSVSVDVGLDKWQLSIEGDAVSKP